MNIDFDEKFVIMNDMNEFDFSFFVKFEIIQFDFSKTIDFDVVNVFYTFNRTFLIRDITITNVFYHIKIFDVFIFIDMFFDNVVITIANVRCNNNMNFFEKIKLHFNFNHDVKCNR